MDEKIKQTLAELDQQEAEVEQNFKNAIAVYFESKAAVKGARQALNYLSQPASNQDQKD